MCSVRYFCPTLTKCGVSRQIFVRFPTSNYTKIRQFGVALIHADRWKGRHGEANGCFSRLMPTRLTTNTQAVLNAVRLALVSFSLAAGDMLNAQTRRPSCLSLRAQHFSAFNLGDQTNMNYINAAYSTHGGEERCMEGFGGKTWGKEPLATPRRRWKNIKMNLQEKGWEGPWTVLTWLRTGTSGELLWTW